MQMTRRMLLAVALVSLVLNQSGCKTTTTKVTFQNFTGLSVDVDAYAIANGAKKTFKQNKIAHQKSFTKSFTSQAPEGTVLFAQGTLKVGNVQYNISPNTVPITVGRTNTIILGVSQNGALTVSVR